LSGVAPCPRDVSTPTIIGISARSRRTPVRHPG
jgi:hypothetical protein